MPWEYTDEYYREYTRNTWNESAPVWAEYVRVLEPFGRELLHRVQAQPGTRVLDIATGSGEPAMTIARQVGPRGHVTGIDLSEKLIEIARGLAADQKLQNCSFEVMDAEKLSLPANSFDLAVSRFGFQIVTDPEAAAKEAHRVLKPGGRIGVTVWGPAGNCPALHTIVGPMLAHAEPDETGYLPTPYEMGGPGEMVAFLEKAGFRRARETRHTHDWRFKDEADYLRMVLEGTPIGHSLREEDPAAQEEILRQTRANLQRWKRTADGIASPAECVVVTAEK